VEKNEAVAWLMKTEPGECSIEDVLQMPDRKVGWFGVRNYQARNFMRDAMKIGQPVLFYHSSCPEPGIVGLAAVASEPYPDPTQFDPASPYYDPKSTLDNPRWVQVDVQVKNVIERITLSELREAEGTATMAVLKKGNRLSITPVLQKEWEALQSLIHAEK
jgi:predicted RNA-binding protein with PUA-like domain